MKARECEVILNTKYGYCMQPHRCKSISEAVRYAKASGMAYRVMIDGKCVKRGAHDVPNTI